MARLDTLISEEHIRERIRELATQIRQDYGDEEILCLGVLKGSYLFLADIARQLGLNTKIDFVQVSSYGDEKSASGVVQIRKDVDSNIEDRHVLIVEDIVDTGLTLAYLKELLGVRKPKSLKVCSLLTKPEARLHDELIDYVGFEIANEFVVGYGLDYAESYRTLPYIAILREGDE